MALLTSLALLSGGDVLTRNGLMRERNGLASLAALAICFQQASAFSSTPDVSPSPSPAPTPSPSPSPSPSWPSSYRFIVNSCGDIKGPTMHRRILEATGVDFRPEDDEVQYSKTWDYMRSLSPDAVFLMGDNVYNDGIQNWGSEGYGSPYGQAIPSYLSDASSEFMMLHGYMTEAGEPGVHFHSYLELLTDKLHDGYSHNDAFDRLRAATSNHIHVTWDDHDYLTNDPSNPHLLRSEFRRVEIDALSGVDLEHMRNPPGSQGIERSWTQSFDNHGQEFVVRFIILDEETTHSSTMGMKYVFDETSPTGWKPVRASGPDQTTPTLNADPAFVEDFENPSRPFFGDDQLAWFVNELKKPADLRLVFNGGPNFEIDYSYASLTDVPGAKRRFVEALREANVEKIVFFAGDSHATYVTKVPDLLPYPIYTVVGSGMTQGLSYDRYVGYWGDISHRHLVAAGSNAKYDNTASFAEVELLFDPEPLLRFTPHLADDARTDGADPAVVVGADANGRWGPWREQTTDNPEEMWPAQYDIRLSELVNQYNEAVESRRFVTESIYLKYEPPADHEVTDVTLSITNAKGATKYFPLAAGASWHLCGEGYWGMCKDKYGAFTYSVPRAGDYIPSHENRAMCEHAGLVGDTISWSITAFDNTSTTVDFKSGTHTLLIRNNALIWPVEDVEACTMYGSSAGGVGCVNFTSTRVSYSFVSGPTIGVAVADIVDEPVLYGGYKTPVKGFDFSTDSFDLASVQELYQQYRAVPGPTEDEGPSEDKLAAKARLSAAYLRAYYPTIEGM